MLRDFKNKFPVPESYKFCFCKKKLGEWVCVKAILRTAVRSQKIMEHIFLATRIVCHAYLCVSQEYPYQIHTWTAKPWKDWNCSFELLLSSEVGCWCSLPNQLSNFFIILFLLFAVLYIDVKFSPISILFWFLYFYYLCTFLLHQFCNASLII